MIEDVMTKVAGRRLTACPGLLRGYAAFRLKDRPDGAMMPFPDTITEGSVYLNVDAAVLSRIAAFVGPACRRIEVTAQAEDGNWVEAEAFVLKLSEKQRLSGKPWSPDSFRPKHLKELFAPEAAR